VLAYFNSSAFIAEKSLKRSLQANKANDSNKREGFLKTSFFNFSTTI
jgi:hypothetical protein